MLLYFSKSSISVLRPLLSSLRSPLTVGSPRADRAGYLGRRQAANCHPPPPPPIYAPTSLVSASCTDDAVTANSFGQMTGHFWLVVSSYFSRTWFVFLNACFIPPGGNFAFFPYLSKDAVPIFWAEWNDCIITTGVIFKTQLVLLLYNTWTLLLSWLPRHVNTKFGLISCH